MKELFKRSSLVVSCALYLTTQLSWASIETTLDFEPKPSDPGAWYDEVKYGMFIHWGLYSHLAQGEWVMLREEIPLAEYKKLAEGFDPVEFEWPDGEFALSGCEDTVVNAYLLAAPSVKLSFKQQQGNLTVQLPAVPLDSIATVLCLEMK